MGICLGFNFGYGVNVTNFGRPWREIKKNWEKVIRFPRRGFCVVICSRVRALLYRSMKTNKSH